ncbi:uncharacterized protein B0I36DRAFT_345809 [Microdochium trichocladiopsis]|uniref:Uncharacterized protein n=1 Tax=Microdochium trichocladiopsis TaxID=1682393 RepID=A0A9P8YGV5_9PEZI|nr:uncharacterized protein B0I36DRAFT_345809 [Microdochium trichocladiopsis]KAH7037734.1 hypothetical protein B0I36DRAFT_345809 [Microdochium trichocladiopsis]
MSRSLIPVSFMAAVLATLIVFIMYAVLAQALRSSVTQVGVAAAIAAVCESLVLALFSALFACQYRGICRQAVASHKYKCCVAAVGAVLLAAIASGAALVCLSEVGGAEQESSPLSTRSYLIALACLLCFTLILQLSALGLFFVGHSASLADASGSVHSAEDGFRSPEMLMRVKAVPYSKTVAARSNLWAQPADSRPCSSSGTISSIRTSISHAVRPISSRTRLLSVRSSRSFKSVHSAANPDLESASGQPGPNSFDSWDTSSIEAPPALLTVDTSLVPSPRFLETIPASPMTSRASSPRTILDSEPSRSSMPRRSRSYSPNARTQSSPAATQPDEAHIHPLFRSDSPSPPMATPGTMVVAAPNAGQIITEKSLSRMRSSSLNGTHRNLSRQGSFESFTRKTISGDESTLIESLGEVDMVPPIPAWVLSAGSRTSLHEYQNRRLKEEIAKDESSRQ